MQHSIKAGKSGGRGRGGGGARPDAERIRVLKDYATRASQQRGSTFPGTVHCELLDYYVTIMLQVYFAALPIAAPLPPPMLRAYVVDVSKGYCVAALQIHRPEITIERVAAHASAAFPQLRTFAAERSAPLRRALEDGEAFDPAVHIWGVDATRKDWAEKYTAAYESAPPTIILYSDMVKAQEAREARERLSNDAVREKRCVRRPRAVQQRVRRADLAGRGHAVLPRRQAHPGRGPQPANPPRLRGRPRVGRLQRTREVSWRCAAPHCPCV